MDLSHRLIALPVALAFAAGAFAAESEPVEKLKSQLRTETGFEVDNVRMASSGAACITYRITNDTGGESRAMAVVQGDKVLRSTSRSREFQDAWNKECVGS
jgi:hypothetical protein